ncbi:hypothetical protein [Paenibacillus sp. QZ-Y1]|uniref:hypothetical protein n=1 Tax=Paenibacillus sp. QZ-Y1 TaxID=3414511 RepID=UPI003F79E44B
MFIGGCKYKNTQDGFEAIAIKESSEFSGHYEMYDIEGHSFFDLESNDWNNWIMID